MGVGGSFFSQMKPLSSNEKKKKEKGLLWFVETVPGWDTDLQLKPYFCIRVITADKSF